MTISESAIIASSDNLKMNWVSYFISRPEEHEVTAS